MPKIDDGAVSHALVAPPPTPTPGPLAWFTLAMLALAMPRCKDVTAWHGAICRHVGAYDVTTPKRLTMFISQCGHESSDFTRLVENLNYSAPALRTLFGKYFKDDATAAAYARQPEKIANRIYADRMANGAEASGDGWKFRGRGILQITGRTNYTTASLALYGDDRLVVTPALLEQPDAAVLAACWFWKINKLNAAADVGDILTATKRINGGTHGLEDRALRYQRAITALEGRVST